LAVTRQIHGRGASLTEFALDHISIANFKNWEIFRPFGHAIPVVARDQE
jgi:hypothetical protein